METPIIDFIEKYISSDTVRMHMPGHKGVDLTGVEKYDLTEISGIGELYTSRGPIGIAEKNTTDLFGTKDSFWITEGSSQTIRAMLTLAKLGSDSSNTVLAARNVHNSFMSAVALLDLDVSWLWPEDDYSLCRCIVTPEMVEKALEQMGKKPIALWLTSPDYLGNISDIGSIAKVCHRYNVPLLVDNAHGSYLHFLDSPIHPMDLGADMCCDSAHKTLGALTGAGYLHISKSADPVYSIEAKRVLAMFGSTSPSWLILRSLDKVNSELNSDFSNRLADKIEEVEKLKQRLVEHGWSLEGNEPMKITINTSMSGYTGDELADILRKYLIECEYADPDYLVLMPSVYSSSDDLLRLENALTNICPQQAKNSLKIKMVKPQRVMTARDAMMSLTEELKVEDSSGRILATGSLGCPPAVSVVTAGEMITDELITVLKHYGIDTVKVVKK